MKTLYEEKQESETLINELAKELDTWNTDRAERALKAVLHALRNKLLFEQSLFIFEQLPTSLKVIFADGWKPRKDGIYQLYELAKFEDIYDFIAEVKKIDKSSSLQDFSTLKSAIKAIKAVFTVLWECVPTKGMEKILEMLPIDLEQSMWELEQRHDLNHQPINFRDISFVLQAGKDKEKQKKFLKKLSYALGYPEKIDKAENTLKNVLYIVRDSLCFEESIELMKDFPVYLKYFYVDNWKTHNEPIDVFTVDTFLAELIFQGTLDNPLEPQKKEWYLQQVKGVFKTLGEEMSYGQKLSTYTLLPEGVKEIWRKNTMPV